jgi:hypothetical protein
MRLGQRVRSAVDYFARWLPSTSTSLTVEMQSCAPTPPEETNVLVKPEFLR